MITDLKELDKEARFFEANGKTYYIETKLSIERYAEFQILEKEAGFGTTFENFYGEVAKAYQDLQTFKAADACVKLHNILTGCADIERKQPTLLKICALFMNTKDEDRATIDDDRIAEKIEDWSTEYDLTGFFHRALNTVSGFFKIYADMHQIISGGKSAN